MNIRFKGKLYSDVSDDRVFFENQFGNFLLVNKPNKSLGINGWIDLSKAPYESEIVDVNKAMVSAKNTAVIFGTDLDLSQQVLATLTPTTDVEDPLRIYVDLLQEGPDDEMIDEIMPEERAKEIVYNDRVQELIQSGLDPAVAIIVYRKELGESMEYTSEELAKISNIENTEGYSVLSTKLLSPSKLQEQINLLAYRVDPSQVNFNQSFGFVKDMAQKQRAQGPSHTNYEWGGNSFKNGVYYGDCSGFVYTAQANVTGGKQGGHPWSTSTIRGSNQNYAGQYSKNGYKNVPSGAIVTSSGHTGIVVGTDSKGVPIVAHSAGGGSKGGKPGSGIEFTTIDSWNKSFGIQHVALRKDLMNKVGSVIPGSPGGNAGKSGAPQGMEATTNIGTAAGQGLFLGNTDPASNFAREIVSNPLSKSVEDYVNYNTMAYEWKSSEGKLLQDKIPLKNPPENIRGDFNYYPVFTGIITNVEKVITTQGYSLIFTFKTPSVFLSNKKVVSLESTGTTPSSAHPGVTTFTDFGKTGEEIVRECLAKAGFNESKNVIQLQKNDTADNELMVSTQSEISASNEDDHAVQLDSIAKRIEGIMNGGEPISDEVVSSMAKESYDTLRSESTSNQNGQIDYNLANTIEAMKNSDTTKMSYPKITDTEKPLINVVGTDTEVYRGIWDAWKQYASSGEIPWSKLCMKMLADVARNLSDASTNLNTVLQGIPDVTQNIQQAEYYKPPQQPAATSTSSDSQPASSNVSSAKDESYQLRQEGKVKMQQGNKLAASGDVAAGEKLIEEGSQLMSEADAIDDQIAMQEAGGIPSGPSASAQEQSNTLEQQQQTNANPYRQTAARTLMGIKTYLQNAMVNLLNATSGCTTAAQHCVPPSTLYEAGTTCADLQRQIQQLFNNLQTAAQSDKPSPGAATLSAANSMKATLQTLVTRLSSASQGFQSASQAGTVSPPGLGPETMSGGATSAIQDAINSLQGRSSSKGGGGLFKSILSTATSFVTATNPALALLSGGGIPSIANMTNTTGLFNQLSSAAESINSVINPLGAMTESLVSNALNPINAMQQIGNTTVGAVKSVLSAFGVGDSGSGSSITGGEQSGDVAATIKTGNGGYPAACDGMTLKEIIEAVCATTNYEAYFDEEGLFWYRPPQFDVNPKKGTRYFFQIKDGAYIRNFTMHMNYDKMFSGAYVTGLANIIDTNEGKDIPTRVDAYVEDPKMRDTIGWKPMINGSPRGGGANFANKYITDTSTAYYYALSQLDRANGQFITGKITMTHRPDLILGRTLYFEFMDLVVYITRIVHKFVPGNAAESYTEVFYSYGRRFDAGLAYNNYGHYPNEPRKGMTLIDFMASDKQIGNRMVASGMNVVDIPGVNSPSTNTSLPSNKYNNVVLGAASAVNKSGAGGQANPMNVDTSKLPKKNPWMPIRWVSQDHIKIVRDLAKQNDVDPDLATTMMYIESKGDKNAVSPNGNYIGLFQMGSAAWTDGSRYISGAGSYTPKDATRNAKAGLGYIKFNSKILQKNGVPINAATLYMAHNQGAGGASKIYQEYKSGKTSSTYSSFMASNPFGLTKEQARNPQVWYPNFMRVFGEVYDGVQKNNYA